MRGSLVVTILWIVAGLCCAVGTQGCSSGGSGTTRDIRDTAAVLVQELSSDAALQHFIDGSIYEMKEQYAQAVLEYQDALRFEKNHAIYYALAKNYLALNKTTHAIEAGREAVRLAPDNLEYRRTLATIYAASFELDAAIDQFEEIIKRDSSDIEAWYGLARLSQGRKPLKALEVYDRITARFGPQWDVLLQEADLCNRMGNHAKAAEVLRKMLEIDPGNQELKHSLAGAYTRAGQLDSAQVLLTELRELDPDDVQVIADLAGVHLLKKEYPKAALLFENILSRDSVTIDVKLRIGEMYFAQIEKDSTVAPLAQNMFERIQEKHPEDWRPYWFLGAIGAVTHDDSLSVRNFRKVTELASWNADAWVYLSSVFMGKNNFAEMARVLESAQKALPDDFRVNFFLGIAYSRLNRSIDAVRVLERAHQINGKDVDATSQLAMVYDGLKRFAESDSLYEEALRLDPKNHLVLNNYSYSLAERNTQLDRALEMSTRAVAADSDNASYLDTIGWIYYKLGRYREAEHYVRKAIAKGQSSGDVSAVVYEHLGDIYYKLNDRESALEQWNTALRLDAAIPGLREKIARGLQ